MRAPAFSGETLAALPTDGWLTNGGNLANQRYSPLGDITPENVARLKAVWRTHLDASGVGSRYSGEAQPIVHEGVIYVPTGANDVFALSVVTGEILWKYEANLDDTISTVCCGWTSRGVALGDGRVFVGQLDGRLVALDQQTGEVAWSVQGEPWQEGYTITGAPLYYDGMVITGFAGAEYATRGRVKAFSADDGELLWTFYVVPGPGEPGHETWPADNEAWRFGGGSVWQTPAVDPELGLIYFSTANANPDLDGSHRAGDNLYTSSVIALDAATGKYRWHFQTVHHDIWDYDMPTPVILFDIEIDGRQRRGLAATGKTGWLYLLDRVSGEPLIGIEERPVPQEPRQATAATQPYPLGDAFVPHRIDIAPEGFELVNDGRIFTPYWDETVVLKPGAIGGANWPPSSYDPQNGVYYVCANDAHQTLVYSAPVDNESPVPGEERIGGTLRSAVELPTFGILAAVDVTTNTLVWQQRWADICYSGSAVTATGLLFIGRNDGRFMAFDAGNGSKLWEFQTDAGVNAPPAIFEYDGTQYVAVFSAGNLFAGSTRGDSVWLFSLEGTLDPVSMPVADSATAAPTGLPDIANASAERGQLIYTQTCAFCHGAEGTGGHGGPALTSSGLDDEAVVAAIFNGQGDMPAFGQLQLLTAEQIGDVAAHIVSDEFQREQ
ncbi:MAG: PQQ-binding-like beta-propeller repeat protein [Gammaproteobacteria bacterium]